MNEISARPANGRLPGPRMKLQWIAILACAAAAKFRVSCVNPFGAKMFSEAGVSVRDFGRNRHHLVPITLPVTARRTISCLGPLSDRRSASLRLAIEPPNVRMFVARREKCRALLFHIRRRS
jgi:hypothetical protein